MAEHVIPESLLENIRHGRAAIVVGAQFGTLAGMPTWKKLLERLRETLAKRGQDGDKAAADDLAALLKKGRLVSATGFLARTLGGPACDEVVAEVWRTVGEVPEPAKALGRIPVRALWTTHPGDLVEESVKKGSPEGWPAAVTVTYGGAGDIDTRRRHILKMLGAINGPDGFVVVPASVRRALAAATAMRALLEPIYREGSLVLVGFRHGDPDLEALLSRVFGTFEPPKSEHYFVGAGLGPVNTDELRAEHHMTVVPLEGQGGDEKSAESLGAYLTALADACDKAGLSLAQTRPADDDVEAWQRRLAADGKDEEARQMFAAMERRAREASNAERLVEVLMAQAEVESEPEARALALRKVATVFEAEIGDLPRAFTALTAALREQPGDEGLLLEVERLAGETDGWSELVADLSAVVPHLRDKKVAAGLWIRLGRWYDEKLRHEDYAIASFREALKLDHEAAAAHAGLSEVFRRQQRWGNLAIELGAHAEVEKDAARKIDVLLSLGDLSEGQLASTQKAIDAYEAVRAIDPANEDALVALERLFRRAERWNELASVLERRATLLDSVNAGRAAAIRRELASVRAERLGDLDGAIVRLEAAKAHGDAETLRALERLYDRAGRFDDYIATLERLTEVGPTPERAATLRRLAAEIEERPGGRAKAIDYYNRLLELEPGARDAYRGLERLLRAEQSWDKVVNLVERQIAAATTPAERVELWVSLGALEESELSDPHRAIEAYQNALVAVPDHRESLVALARLYQRVEAWERAVEILDRHAELAGGKGADLLHEAGVIYARRLQDEAMAESRFARALELEPTHVATLRSQIELCRRRREYGRAAQLMLEAERATQNRLERVVLLAEAAQLHAERLDHPEIAAELYGRVLELDPEHVNAGLFVADRWLAAGRNLDAEPVLEMLVRRADPEDRVEKARRLARLGHVAEALGQPEKAARNYRAAVNADPDSLEAALGLAALLHAGKEWVESERRYREILARHRPALAEGQVVDIWYRLGIATKERGDGRAAEDALRRALERDPSHRPSRRLLTELCTARGDWKAVVELRRAELEAASDEERVALLEEIGDLYHAKLEDPVSALGAYLEGQKLRPKSHVLLHKILEIYTEQKQWRRAVDTLGKLIEQEKDASVRAKYAYTAAVITRDELKEPDEAVEHFTHALDDAPTMPKAFDAVERILGERGDWKGLVRAYRRMIKRLGDSATPPQLLQLWGRMGDVAREKLGDKETAIVSYETALALEPGNAVRREHLATLYLDSGAAHADKAAAELQALLVRAPDRIDVFRQLSRLYSETNQRDKAYCLACAMVLLGAASPDETARAAAGKGGVLPFAKRRLTEELWQKAVIHHREDRAFGAILGALMPVFAATTAQPHSALELDPKNAVNLDSDGHALPRLFRYLASTLGLQPTPELYIRPPGRDGIRAANIVEKNVLVPAVLIGEPHASKKAERELCFELAKRLCYFRPERYSYFALPTLPRLEAAVEAGLVACGAAPARKEAEQEKLVAFIKRSVATPVLDHVGALAKKLGGAGVPQLVGGFITASDLTANRVGLILCDDLETAGRMVATEQGVQTTLAAKDRLRDLLVYAVSEEYFTVRRHLGLEVA